MPFRFESLDIWHESRQFSNRVHRMVGRFPDEERFGLSSQIMRAANSVALNIAEGSGRDSQSDFNRFLGIAVASVCEVVSASYLAHDRGYISEDTHQLLYEEAEKLAKRINAFRKTLR